METNEQQVKRLNLINFDEHLL